jgi:threonine aldolase
VLVDLRSDTLTKPTPGMRKAMLEAEIGDDVWGEDPTARRLEERAAEILGKEAALFVPSGTMANQIAVMLHCGRGDEAILGQNAHLRLYESAGAAAWAGAQLVEVGEGGLFDVADLEAAIQPDDSHAPRTRMVAIENTHNRAGGKVWPLEQLDRVTARAKQLGLMRHLDGARLWNAAAALGVPEARLTAGFDSVSACFSKGLGAPVGSAIAGSRALVKEAHRLRKRLGGGMRQVGFLCGAALYALDHQRERLKDDHRRARTLADGLRGAAGTRPAASVETNIVVFGADDPRGLVERAKEAGVLVAPFGAGAVRAVTHHDVDDAGITRAIEVLRRAAVA